MGSGFGHVAMPRRHGGELRGELEVLASRDGARMRAVGDSEITGYGLVIRLDPGDEILLEGLGSTEERQAAMESAIETP